MAVAQGTIQEKIMALREKTGAGIMDCKKALVESNGDIEKAVESLRKKGLADVAKRAARSTKEGVVSAAVSADGKTAALVELNCETDFVAKTPDFKKLGEDAAAYVLANPAVADYAQDENIKKMVLAVAPKLGENMAVRRAVCYKLSGEGVLNYYVHTDFKKAALVELTSQAADKEALKTAARELAMQVVALSPRYVSKENVPAEVVAKEKEIYTTQAKNQGKPDEAIAKMLEGRVRKFYEEICLVQQASIRDSKVTVENYLKNLGTTLGGEVKAARFTRYQLGQD